MKVCYLVLVYNNIDDTLETLDGIRSQDFSGIDTLVVDNNSNEECVSAVSSYCEKNGMQYIHRQTNDGYSGGNNFGWNLLKDKYEYVFVVNNDIVFKSPSVTSMIVNFFEEHPEAGLVGPTVFFGNNQIVTQTSLIHFFFHKIYKKDWLETSDFYECSSFIGCFVAARTSAVKRDFLFDDSFFMYSEEMELDLFVLANGMKNFVMKSLENSIYHKGGCNPFDSARGWKYYLSARNMVLCSRHFSFFKRMMFCNLVYCSVLRSFLKREHSFKNKLLQLKGFYKGLWFLLSKKSHAEVLKDSRSALEKFN